MPYTQDNTYLSISTPLGKDKLLLRSFQGEEPIAGLFYFRLNMQSETTDLDFTAIVGKTATITVLLADGSKRYINGIVSHFVQAGADQYFASYYAELVPWFWLCDLAADCRIFQNKSTPDILKALFTDLGFTDFKDSLTGTYDPRRILRAVQRDRLRVRLAADGGGGDLLLLRARGREAHPGARRRLDRRRSGARRRHRRRRGLRQLGAAERGVPQRAGAAGHLRQVRGRRLQLRDPLDRPDGERRLDRRDRRRQAPGLRVPGRVHREGQGGRAGQDPHRGLRAAGEDPARRQLLPRLPAGLQVHPREALPRGRQRRLGALDDLPRRHLRRLLEHLRGLPGGRPLPAGAAHAQAGHPRHPDRDRGRQVRRGDLDRQVRPGEGPVPLGPEGQEGREQLLLDPGRPRLGGQGLGADLSCRASGRRWW